MTQLHTATHDSKNVPGEHLLNYYKSFAQVHRQMIDDLIITGAPVEQMPFEDLDYWQELRSILDWAETNVFVTLYICWGAQAGLHHRYGIPKVALSRKMSGVFPQKVIDRNNKLMSGFDDLFFAPHSHHTKIRRADLENIQDTIILAESDEAGINFVASKDGRYVIVTGHSEYDQLTP